jgi:hypothetical protein
MIRCWSVNTTAGSCWKNEKVGGWLSRVDSKEPFIAVCCLLAWGFEKVVLFLLKKRC